MVSSQQIHVQDLKTKEVLMAEHVNSYKLLFSHPEMVEEALRCTFIFVIYCSYCTFIGRSFVAANIVVR